MLNFIISGILIGVILSLTYWLFTPPSRLSSANRQRKWNKIPDIIKIFSSLRQQNNPSNYLSVKQVAQQLNVSEKLIRQLCRENLIVGARQLRTNGPWQIPQQALDSISKIVSGESGVNQLASKSRLFNWLKSQRLAVIATILTTVCSLLLGFISAGADFDAAQKQLRRWIGINEIRSAGDRELLIVIPAFYYPPGQSETDIHNEIKRSIKDAFEKVNAQIYGVNYRVETLSGWISDDSTDKAREIGEKYNADLVIWGSDTGIRVTVNFLNLREHKIFNLPSNKVEITSTENNRLANPQGYVKYVTKDLPSQLSYLSLFAVANSFCYCENGKRQEVAIVALETAIESLKPSADLAPHIGIAYFRLGWLYQTYLKNPTKAINEYTLALNLAPLEGIYFNRGLAYRTNGEMDAAIADYTKAIDLKPDYADAYVGRGIAYATKPQFDLAIRDYTKAIELSPDDSDAYTMRGGAYYRIERFDNALSDLNKAIELKPDNATAYQSRGLLYAAQLEFSKALLDYDVAIMLSPNDPNSYNNRGIAYWKMNNSSAAFSDYNKAIGLRPNFAEVYNNRGILYLEKQQVNAALSDYNKAIKLKPDYTEAYKNRGHAYSKLDQYEKAIKDYTEVIRLNPNDEGAYLSRGSAYSKLDQHEKAIKDYTEVIRLNPNDEGAYLSRGSAYSKLGQNTYAIKDYTEAIHLNPDDVRIYLRRANTYDKLGQHEKVIEDYTEAIRRKPDDESFYFNRANAYSKFGKYEQAIKDYDWVIHLKPNYANAYFSRGYTYRSMQEYQLAIADFEKFLSMSQDPYWQKKAEQHLAELSGK